MRSLSWDTLSRIARKEQLYARETYFREGLADALEILGPASAEALRRTALLMIKADGLISGKAAPIVQFIEEHAFCIRSIAQVILNRFQWRELWRFQLTSATLDRLTVNDLVLTREHLMLILRDDGACEVPATVRLSTLKGPSDVAQQSATCLRRVLGQPNRVFSFFHVADEPADLLRELTILLDSPARRRALLSMISDEFVMHDKERLSALIADAHRSSRVLHASAALRRVSDALAQAAYSMDDSQADALRAVRSNIVRMERNERIDWGAFVSSLRSAGIQLDPWDLATLGANFIVYDEPGHPKQLTGVDPTLWIASPVVALDDSQSS